MDENTNLSRPNSTTRVRAILHGLSHHVTDEGIHVIDKSTGFDTKLHIEFTDEHLTYEYLNLETNQRCNFDGPIDMETKANLYRLEQDLTELDDITSRMVHHSLMCEIFTNKTVDGMNQKFGIENIPNYDYENSKNRPRLTKFEAFLLKFAFILVILISFAIVVVGVGTLFSWAINAIIHFGR